MRHNFKKETITPVGLYESNYRKVINLFPALASLQKQLLQQSQLEHVNFTDNERVYSSEYLSIKVLDIYRYTTIIKLFRQLPIKSTMMAVNIKLRLCHDARLAEVIGFQEMDSIKKYFHYPNDEMLLIDEKKQLNLHVKEMLDMAIKGQQEQPVLAEG